MHFYSVGLNLLNISDEIETGVFNIQNCIPWPLTSDKKILIILKNVLWKRKAKIVKYESASFRMNELPTCSE